MSDTPAKPSHPRRVLAIIYRLRWVLGVLAIGLLIAWFKVWSPVHVKMARVERGTVVLEAFGRGTIESQREAAVGFDLIGRVSEVLVDEGGRVTIGQELARLETSQSQAELKSAQTGVGAARAALQRLAADEERARTLLATAEREARRTQALFDAGAVPGQQRDDMRDKLALN